MTSRSAPFASRGADSAAVTSAPRCTTRAGNGRPAISSQRRRAQLLFAITRSAALSAATHARRPIELRTGTWIMSGPCAETTNADEPRRRTQRAAACPAGARQWAWTTSNGHSAYSRSSARPSGGDIQ